MSAATRRAALGAILAGPLASVPVVAVAASSDLVHLIAQHDAHRAIMDNEDTSSNETCREAGRLRALITRYPSRGWSDTIAKAACLARLWTLQDAEEELAHALRDNHAYLETMAFGIACEVMRMTEAQRCT